MIRNTGVYIKLYSKASLRTTERSTAIQSQKHHSGLLPSLRSLAMAMLCAFIFVPQAQANCSLPSTGCINPAGVAGVFLYNNDQKVMQYCNGTDWIGVGPLGGSGGAGCANPAGVEQEMIYNETSRVLQYCNGNDWIAMGPVGPSGPMAGCSNPAGASGQIIYNTDSVVMQYCDGDTWQAIGELGTVGITLQMGPATRETLGADLSGSANWAGGVLGNNNKIYGIPYNATDILIIDPGAGTATRSSMGADLTGTNKWEGGVLGSDGKIYGIPRDSTDILIIDPGAGTATRSAMGADLSGTTKWIGGAVGSDGKIYGIPMNATDILIINPGAGTATRSAMGANLSGTSKWIGGVAASNGKIYGIPFSATDILIIDPGAGTATRSAMGATLADAAKWEFGALGADGKVYGIPYTATDILIIDPGAGTATRSAMGANLTGNQKWVDGVAAPDEKIYGMPHNNDGTDDILIIDPGAGTATRDTLGANLSGTASWLGGVLGADNKVYGITFSAADILIIGNRGCSEPLPFTFTDVTGATYNTQYESDIVQITGISSGFTADISIGGTGSPEYRICSNNDCSTEVQTWGSTAATISDGQYVQLRLMSGASSGETRTATLTIDIATDDWSVTSGPKRVFVTSLTYGPNMGGITSGDSNCQARADAVPLGGTWKAWLSNSTVNAKDRITAHPIGWELLNGTLVANDMSDLTNGTIAAAINRDENNTAVAASDVWTGTLSTGLKVSTDSAKFCNDWSFGGGGAPKARYGGTGSVDGNWTDTGVEAACNSSNRRLYCFEQ